MLTGARGRLGGWAGAAALAFAASGIRAADLEVTDPRGPRPPVQANPNFPYQHPMFGQLLQFTPSDAAVSALREKIAKHAEKPVLVLLAPDGNFHPSQNFRVVWLGNLLHSNSDDMMRFFSQVEVAVAQAGTLRSVLADVRTDALAYLIGTRDGKPFAWTLSAATPTEQALLQAFGPAVLTGKDVADRTEKSKAALDAKVREKVTAAIKDLGHDSYERREAASAALAGQMPAIAGWIQAEMEAAQDVEVRSRCNALLTDAGRAWHKHAPVGCSWLDANHGIRFGKGAIMLQNNVQVLQAQGGAVIQLKAAIAVQEVVQKAAEKVAEPQPAKDPKMIKVLTK